MFGKYIMIYYTDISLITINKFHNIQGIC